MEQGIKERLGLLQAVPRLIPNAKEAEKYFNKASLRKEAVFLSYSGEDEEIAAKITIALKARFQDVFNYKDGESIRPGQPWQAEIELKLRRAAVGVPFQAAFRVRDLRLIRTQSRPIALSVCRRSASSRS